MNILIPVDESDIEEAQLVSLDEASFWLLLDVTDGKVISSQFFQTREEISDWIDVAIVKNQQENVWPLMDEGIAILVAPLQRYVDDIVEAYLFKELHDMNV
jgi:predicted Fe-Mo cluster-binding NifX family protein